MDLEQQLGNLRLADEHIARGRSLIEHQLETVHKLKLSGDARSRPSNCFGKCACRWKQ